MLHGDIVTLTEEGIVVHEKALQPLAIFDKSACWGVWAANPHKGHPQRGHPNLIISPFHPTSWPFLIRLQVVIENARGALVTVCRLIAENDLSILYSECTPTGFSHATLTVIAESTRPEILRLREEKQENVDRPYARVRLDGPAYEAAREAANHIAANMFLHVRDIKRTFRKQAAQLPLHTWDPQHDPGYFLYERDTVVEHMRELRPDLTDDDCVHHLKSHLPRPVTARYMQRLAYFSIYGGGEEVPLPFNYEAKPAFLKLAKEEIKLNSDESVGLGELPLHAVATFNSGDKYLRLNPIKHGLLRHELTRISVRYKGAYEPGDPERGSAKASQGLLRSLCEELVRADVDLIHVTNKWTHYGYDKWAGLISFIADADARDHKRAELRQHIGSLDRTKSQGLSRVKLEKVEVYQYPKRQLFVSMRLDTPRGPELFEIVEEVALKRGFMAVDTVDSATESVTPTVRQRIRSFDAFLQLLSFREDEDPEKVDFLWLSFEHGIAYAFDKPMVRLVDTVRGLSEAWWRNRVHTAADQRMLPYSSGWPQPRLREVIERAVEELTQKIATREQEGGPR